MKITVSDSFEGGNIELVEKRHSATGDPEIIELVLRIKKDRYTELEEAWHLQYFCFRVTLSCTEEQGELVEAEEQSSRHQQQKIKFIIDNAEHTSYPEAWTGFTVFVSRDVNDVDSWTRNKDTFYLGGKLTWEQMFDVSPHSNNIWYYSFFPPYSYQRHLQFISKCASESKNKCIVTSLGQSLEGRDIECIQTGTGTRTAWIIHRQHPGETMAEHYAEGLLSRLLGLNPKQDEDADVQQLLKLYTFYIVPCMCPDGGVLGHLRTNASGANLNREWATKTNMNYEAPSLQRSPEVYCVLEKMDRTGCDFFLDVHGDEELPYNFISGARHVPQWCQRLESLHGAFLAEYARATTDFQRKFGYPPVESTDQAKKYLNIATMQIAERFACLSMTLEMPFKDCRSNPDPDYGWSPARSRQLGAAIVAPLLYVHPYLRSTEDFWNQLPVEDGYIVMTDDYQKEDHEERNEQFILLHKRYFSDVHEIHKAHPKK